MFYNPSPCVDCQSHGFETKVVSRLYSATKKHLKQDRVYFVSWFEGVQYLKVEKACGRGHRPMEVQEATAFSLSFSLKTLLLGQLRVGLSGSGRLLSNSHRDTKSCLLGDSKSLRADSEGIIGRFLAARLLPPNITPKVEEGVEGRR